MKELFVKWRSIAPDEVDRLQSMLKRVVLDDLAPAEATIVRDGAILQYVQTCCDDRGWEWEISHSRLGAVVPGYARVSRGLQERVEVCEGKSAIENLLGAYVSSAAAFLTA